MAETKIISLDCECCGGQFVKVTESQYKCDHCGYTKYIETAASSEVIALFNQANNLRNKGEFDDATEIFNQVAQKDPNNPDGYWGLFLSEYGIMHVEDPATKKYMPTVNRASSISVFEDSNYKKVIELSSDIQKTDYTEKAETIENIRKKVVELSKNESPYDVFICYKRTQSIVNGKETYTEDAINARDIYDILTAEGYKVFFAEKTLQNLGGTEYEPLIYNALNTSKVMLVVCSDPALINAPWVKNEWRRFIKQMEFDETKKLMPIMCGGMKAGRLPDMLKKYQGLEMNATFQTNLVGSVSKIIDLSRKSKIARVNVGGQKDVKKSNIVKTSIQTRSIGSKEDVKLIVSDEKILKLAFSYVEKGMLKEASREFNMLSKSENITKIVAFANTYIKFKAKDVSVDIIKPLNECIEVASTELVGTIFATLSSDIKQYLLNKGDVARASKLYRAIMSWENDKNKEVFDVAKNYVKAHANKHGLEIAKAVADCFNNQDVDGYIDLLEQYINIFASGYYLKGMSEVLTMLLEVDPGNINARWKSFLISFGATDEKYIPFCVSALKKEHLEKFKDFLGYVNEDSRTKYINLMCSSIAKATDYVSNNERFVIIGSSTNKYLEYFAARFAGGDTRDPKEAQKIVSLASTSSYSGYFTKRMVDYHSYYYMAPKFRKFIKETTKQDPIYKSENFFKKLKYQDFEQIFDEYIKFYSQTDQKDLISHIFAMAETCKEKGEFKLAQKYYNLMITEDNTSHKAYWGLLQCKLKCPKERDLMYHKRLSDHEEFNNAVRSAGVVDDSYAVDKYLAVQKEQGAKKPKGYTKKAKLNKYPSKLKKAFRIVVGIILIGAILGYSGWYWWTTPVVVFKNYKGEVVEELQASERGGTVDPDESLYTRPDDVYGRNYVLTGWSEDFSSIDHRMWVTPEYDYDKIYHNYTLSRTGPEHGGAISYKTSSMKDFVGLDAGQTVVLHMQYGEEIIIKIARNQYYQTWFSCEAWPGRGKLITEREHKVTMYEDDLWLNIEFYHT